MDPRHDSHCCDHSSKIARLTTATTARPGLAKGTIVGLGEG